jgi:hypothetical protein
MASPSSQENDGMQVAFVSFERANFPAIEPVARALLKHPTLRPVIVQGYDHKEATGQIPPLTLPPDLPSTALHAWERPGDREAAERAAERLHRSLRDGVASAAGGLGATARAFAARTYWPELFTQRQLLELAFDRLLLELRPCVAVVADDAHWAQGHLAAQRCSAHAVPTLAVLAPYYQLIAATPLTATRRPQCDLYAAMNAEVAALLSSRGVPPHRIVSCASPYFAHVPKPPRSPEKRATRFIAALQGKPCDGTLANDLCGIFARLPELSLTIKLHPDHPSLAIDASQPANIRIARTGRLADALADADCVIGVSSAGLCEAVAAGLAIIVVAYDTVPDELRLPRAWRTGLVVRDASGLDAAVQRAATGDSMRLESTLWLGDTAGATLAVVAAIERLALCRA